MRCFVVCERKQAWNRFSPRHPVSDSGGSERAGEWERESNGGKEKEAADEVSSRLGTGIILMSTGKRGQISWQKRRAFHSLSVRMHVEAESLEVTGTTVEVQEETSAFCCDTTFSRLTPKSGLTDCRFRRLLLRRRFLSLLSLPLLLSSQRTRVLLIPSSRTPVSVSLPVAPFPPHTPKAYHTFVRLATLRHTHTELLVADDVTDALFSSSLCPVVQWMDANQRPVPRLSGPRVTSRSRVLLSPHCGVRRHSHRQRRRSCRTSCSRVEVPLVRAFTPCCNGQPVVRRTGRRTRRLCRHRPQTRVSVTWTHTTAQTTNNSSSNSSSS